MATFQLFVQSVRAKDLSAPLSLSWVIFLRKAFSNMSNNYREQSSLEASSHSVKKCTPCLDCGSVIVITTTHHSDPVHILLSYFYINFNCPSIYPCCFRLSFLIRVCDQNIVRNFIFTICSTWPAHLIVLNFIVLFIFVENKNDGIIITHILKSSPLLSTY